MSSNYKSVLIEVGKPPIEIQYKPVSWDENDHRWHYGDVEFDGHHVLWGVSIQESNYMKESELSGDEYRKACMLKITRNGEQIWEEFSRTADGAARKLLSRLPELQEFWSSHGTHMQVGHRLFYREIPSVIKMLILDQGCIVLEREDGLPYPPNVWNSEDGISYDRYEARTAKIEYLSPHIWWWRDEQ